MSQICVPTVFPEFTAIFLAIRELMITIPNFDISLPTVPSPFMRDIEWPTLKALNISIELATFSILNFLYLLASPILGFLSGFGIDIPWPKVPILDIELPALLAIDMAALVLLVKGRFPDLTKFYAMIPTLPTILFSGIAIPSLQIIEAIQALIRWFIITTTTWIISLFNTVLGIVNAKPFSLGISLPSFPTLPTSWDALIALLGIPNLDLNFKIPTVDINKMFAGISIPSFPGFNLSMPDFSILFPDLRSPSISFYQLTKVVFLALVTVVLSLFKAVADLLSSVIGFSFPQICVPVVAPTVSYRPV